MCAVQNAIKLSKVLHAHQLPKLATAMDKLSGKRIKVDLDGSGIFETVHVCDNSDFKHFLYTANAVGLRKAITRGSLFSISEYPVLRHLSDISEEENYTLKIPKNNRCSK
ncbi:hypothetical protein TetV_344 [Tetraselmis virus 1]|uniref:Uncharacterized protein n=1 Tax=Tetraselmis virus 1 TaxID=2060617 RepID=A0A2P0VNF1_9VIRU|nr:hypothetical protein QJ968_gp344 [Tetraselmis virus 1]AUF82436.1 hypothetical protein TetV_344 [Tetraselmis virus 1]